MWHAFGLLAAQKNLDELLQFPVWVDLTSSTFWLMFGHLKRGDKKGIGDIC